MASKQLTGNSDALAERSRERQLIAEVLKVVGQKTTSARKVTGFMAMVGKRYDHELMVVGRAVNGWIRGASPEELGSDVGAEDFSRLVLEGVSGKDDSCPMQWVTDQWSNKTEKYNTNKSAFWRVIRGVVAGLRISDFEETSWPSHLVWSNLYKVSPEAGGNPGKVLCRIQEEGCIELFNLELATYTPSRLLLLTGYEWASPFLPDTDGAPEDVTGFQYVKRIGTRRVSPDKQPIRYVVAEHPQTRREQQWIEEVCKAFDC